ncbi:MAG: hypothetical protein ACQEP5_00860 [Actinomycetota bacterium]
MVTTSNYGKEEVKISLSVLVELMTVLGNYRNNIVLIGGWVPYFILDSNDMPHVGSIDIDLALNFKEITDESYKTILDLLNQRGYRQGSQPNIFLREIQIKNGNSFVVQVDLLSGEYGGTTKSHRMQRVQNIKARKVRGCDLAFEYNILLSVHSVMPDGAKNSVDIKIASVIPFLVMKGMAIWERKKEKDAYDIYYTVSNYPGGINNLIDVFKPVVDNKLVQEGLGKIYSKFSSIDSIGPTWLIQFLNIEDREEVDRLKRDSFERIIAIMQKLGIKEFFE